MEGLRGAAIVGGQGPVRREVLVAHVAEPLPLVIVAHFAVAVPGVEPQPAPALLARSVARPTQHLGAYSAASEAATDRELVHIDRVALLFGPYPNVALHQRHGAADARCAVSDIHATRIDVGGDARQIEFAPGLHALLLVPAARFAQEAHHRIEIGAGRRGDRELHQSWCCGFTRSILLSSLLSALM